MAELSVFEQDIDEAIVEAEGAKSAFDCTPVNAVLAAQLPLFWRARMAYRSGAPKIARRLYQTGISALASAMHIEGHA